MAIMAGSLGLCNLTYSLLTAHQNSSKLRHSSNCPPESDQYSTSVSEDEQQYDNERFPGYIRYTATVFCVVILVLGIAGNTVVPIVVCKTKELSNSTNIFLVNLSIADLLVLVVCMPTVLMELHSKPEVWPLGVGMCKIVPFVELMVAHGSILTMLAISLERYYAICRPLKAGYTCTKMRALIIIVVVWVVAVVVTCPVLIISELVRTTYIDGSDVHVCLTSAQNEWQRNYFFVTIACFFFLPFVVLVVLYGVIAKRLMMDASTILNSSVLETQMKARRQVVMLLVAVISCFFICLMPFRVFTLWVLIVPDEQIQELGMEAYYNVLYFCRVMLYINSASNPILYNLISSKFREAFLRLFCGSLPSRLSRNSAFNTTYTSVTIKASSCVNIPCQVCSRQASPTPTIKCDESAV